MQPQTFDNKDHLYLFDIPDHSVQSVGRPKFLRGEKSREKRKRQINNDCQPDLCLEVIRITLCLSYRVVQLF